MDNKEMMPTDKPGEYVKINQGGTIYQLIGKAIGKIGAIGKDKINSQQGFKYRGIDQVYNALNPVMAELGIFFCPEVLDQKREERVTKNGSVLTYTLLTMRFTVYAPDGSNVSMTVVGEGMDSGDKSSNKAMSVAMKYAMFQLFCIPTEELKDPDADVYQNILPRGAKPTAQTATQTAAQTSTQTATQAQVGTGGALPSVNPPEKPTQPAPKETTKPMSEGAAYLTQEKKKLEQELGADFSFGKARLKLVADGVVENIPSAIITLDQAKELIKAMRDAYGKRVS